MPAWASPDGSVPPSADLAPGTQVEVGEERGPWAHVTAENGWTGWVDGSRLVTMSALLGVPPGVVPPPGATTEAVLLVNVSYPLASIGRRVGARLIDGVIVFAAFFVIAFPIAAATVDADEEAGFSATVGGTLVSNLVGLALVGPYETLFVARKGGTPGKLAMGIRVASIHTAGHPELPQALKRWALPGLAGVVPFVGGLGALVIYLSATWGAQRRGWHDRLADTVVVRTR